MSASPCKPLRGCSALGFVQIGTVKFCKVSCVADGEAWVYESHNRE